MVKTLLLTFVVALLAGCAPTLAPHIAYLPAIREKGQAEARVSTGLNGSELQVGYQVTDKLVVYSALLNRYGRYNTGEKIRSADLGLGYYYNSPNGFWRLGGHAGAAYGSGTSGTSGGCFECVGSPSPAVAYRMRYTYAYVQPTVLLLEGNHTWGVGLRMGRAYYHRLTESSVDTVGGPVQSISYAGRQSNFMQATFQFSRRLAPWFALSGSFGAQGFLKNSVGPSYMSPFIGQVGLHFIVSPRPAPQP